MGEAGRWAGRGWARPTTSRYGFLIGTSLPFASIVYLGPNAESRPMIESDLSLEGAAGGMAAALAPGHSARPSKAPRSCRNRPKWIGLVQ